MLLSYYPNLKCFFGKICPKIWSPPKWLKFGTGVHCYMLITILTFIFSKFLSFIFLGLSWSQNLNFSKLTEICYRVTLLYAYYDFNVYFFKIFVSHTFLGKFCLKILSSLNWLKFGAGLLHYFILITVSVWKFCHSYNFGKTWSQNLMSQLTGI